MSKLILISLLILFMFHEAIAQTYDEARHQLNQQEEEAERQQQIQRLQAQNSVMQYAAQAFANHVGETLASGPSCQTYNEIEPVDSYWFGSLALRARDTFKNTAFKQCDFSTSGGSRCKSLYTVANGALAAEVECITPQQTDDRYLVTGKGVHRITAQDYIWSLARKKSKVKNRRRH